MIPVHLCAVFVLAVLTPVFPTAGEGIQLLGDEGDDMEQEEQEPRERRDFPET